jgi:hypothetical protein
MLYLLKIYKKGPEQGFHVPVLLCVFMTEGQFARICCQIAS